MHRRKRRHCRRHYVLRTEFSADATGFSNAPGIRPVSLDSIACLVRFGALDFVPGPRHTRTESRNQFRLIRRAFGRSSGRPRVAPLATKQRSRNWNALTLSSFVIRASSFENAFVILCSAFNFRPAIFPPVPHLWDKSVSEARKINNRTTAR